MTDLGSPLMETKSSQKGSSFSAKMPLIKLVGAATNSSKISSLVPQEHQIRMRSDKCFE